jgi:hypothetical protein
MTSSSVTGPSVHVKGNVSGQVAAGTFVYQVQAPGGVVNQFVVKEPIRARTLPCLIRPRRPPVPIGRDSLISGAIAALQTNAVQLHASDGWGKSATLKHLAYDDALAAWRGGVVFLSGYGRPIEDLEQDLFDAFYESVLPDARVRATPSQLRSLLGNVAAVVLVDDADVPSQHLERLLDDAPSCAFVVTSNERSLSGATPIAIGGLAEQDATSLFERGLGRSLTGNEGRSVARLAQVGHGHPQALIIAAAAVRRDAISIEGLADLRSVEHLVAALRDGLDANEVRVLELLAAVGGAPLPVNVVEEIAVANNAGATLDRLSQDGLVLSASPRFRLSSWAITGLGVPDATIQQREAEVLSGLTRWARRTDEPEQLVAAGPAIISVAEALCEREPEQVIELTRVAHAGLVLTGQWGTWTRLLEVGLQSAARVGDKASSAWALHELGTHALLVGNHDMARLRLEDALKIREQIDDAPGIEVTRHNLRTLRAWRNRKRWRRVVLSAVVIAILAVAVVLLVRWFRPDEAGALTIGVREVDFGDVPVGEVREARVSLTNQGDGALDVTSIAVDAPFTVQHDCGRLAPGSGCEVRVVFSAPGDPGLYQTALDIQHVDGGEATGSSVAVRGTSVPPAAVSLDVQPPLVDFGVVQVGGPVAEQVVTVSNLGGTAADVAVDIDGDPVFDLEQHCGPLEPGQICDAIVRFASTEPGNFSATLRVEQAGGDEIDVPISGVVAASPETTHPRALISVDPSEIDFGPVQFSDGVVTRAVTISNAGSIPGEIRTSLADGSLFAVAQSCERVEPGSTCEVIVKFAATESGTYADTLHIEPDDGDAFDIPVGATVPTAPDLASEIVDAGGATTQESDGIRYWVVPITVVISNSGEAPVGDPFRLSAETGSRSDPIVLQVWDGKSPASGTTVDPPLEPGEKREIDIGIAFDARNYKEGQTVDVRVVVDSCVGERSFVVPPCRIVEERETNNVSADFPVHIEIVVE